MADKGMIVKVRWSEMVTGKLDRPMSKTDLDIFRTHIADGTIDEDTTLARDFVLAFRAGSEWRRRLEKRILDAILGEEA